MQPLPPPHSDADKKKGGSADTDGSGGKGIGIFMDSIFGGSKQESVPPGTGKDQKPNALPQAGDVIN